MKHKSVVFAALVCIGAQAQQSGLSESQRQLMETPMNAYRFIGNSLVCKSDQSEFNSNACNRIGTIAVGDDWAKTAARMGPPSRVISGQNGVTTHVYFLHGPDGARVAYWVLDKSEARSRVVAIQLTGAIKVPGASFSAIELTDPEDKVRKLLGPRFALQPMPQIQGVMWDYAPFKFSIQFVNGRVYSIRVGEES
jgi:hypothetical protein